MSNVNADATQLLTILKNMRTSISSIETTRSSVKIDYSGRSAHALKRVQRTGIAVQQSSAAVQPRPLGMG